MSTPFEITLDHALSTADAGLALAADIHRLLADLRAPELSWRCRVR